MRSGSETMIPPTRNFVTSIHNFAQTWHFYWEIHCIFTFLLDAFRGVECWIENLTRSDWCLSSSPHLFQHTQVFMGTKQLFSEMLFLERSSKYFCNNREFYFPFQIHNSSSLHCIQRLKCPKNTTVPTSGSSFYHYIVGKGNDAQADKNLILPKQQRKKSKLFLIGLRLM